MATTGRDLALTPPPDREPEPWVAGQTVGERPEADRVAVSRSRRRGLPGASASAGRGASSTVGSTRSPRRLIGAGRRAGEHVGIWSMNVPEWVVTQFAVGRIGVVLVNVNPAYRLHELEEALRAGRRGDPDRRRAVQGVGLRRGWSRRSAPRSAAAGSPDWSSARLPELRRLVAIGRPARAGLARLGRPGAASATARARSTREGAARRRRRVTTSSSPRGRPGCPRGPCSRIATC